MAVKISLLLFTILVDLHRCIDIKLDTKKAVRTVNEKFASVAIDSGIMVRHWEKFNPGSTKIQALARALSPSYLRFGGTDADVILFEDGPGRNQAVPSKKNLTQVGPKELLENYRIGPEVHVRSKRDIGYIFPERKRDNFTMTTELFDELNNFAASAGFDLVFGLNEMLRHGDSWYPSNALKLMEYTVKKGYPVAGWELGNEPNAYFHQWGKRIEPEQLAADFKTLKQMASNFTTFKRGIILGPSTTQLNKKTTIEYFTRFLESGGGEAVTSVCFHQYYVNARTATIDQFTDPDILNILIDEVTTGHSIKNKTTQNTLLWLGETSSAWGGGAKGLSDRYVAGFMWMDKLGVAAKFGVDVVARQGLYGGHYSLIDFETHDPLPDYWLTLLYKKLVGRTVLSVILPDSKGKLRAYAHCAHRANYNPGSVVIFAMNLNSFNITMNFPDFHYVEGDIDVYLLHPANGDLLSSTVLLNGRPLRMLSDTQLPPLLPSKQKSPVILPSYTFGFVVIPNANVEICL